MEPVPMRPLPSCNTRGQYFNRPEIPNASQCASIIFSKSLSDRLFQLKNIKVQGKMHCNDSRERIKLNTLSLISFPRLLSPAFSAASVCAGWVSASVLCHPVCRATAMVKERRARLGLRGSFRNRSFKVTIQQDEVRNS